MPTTRWDRVKAVRILILFFCEVNSKLRPLSNRLPLNSFSITDCDRDKDCYGELECFQRKGVRNKIIVRLVGE